ncbi:unnamed protein product [Blepharisma stoltei]|uniref:Uncharacterized protein n=1 Tax=Blepharisma stoltei TaxID=1481888 RepID=A0AAU9KAU3_9CILI|nr:unnamed protein product [Blepharisma stoltei]
MSEQNHWKNSYFLSKNPSFVSEQKHLEKSQNPETKNSYSPPPLRERTKPLEKSPFFDQKPTLREWTKIFLIEKILMEKKFWYISDN